MLSFKYRVYPSSKQTLRLNRQMFLAKEIYNLIFDKAKEHYKQTGKMFTQFDMNKYISQLKKEKPEFKELHSQAAQNTSKRLADAYSAFFRRLQERKKGSKIKVGFPRRKKYVSSLTYPQSGFKFKNERRLTLSKIGCIPIVLHRVPKGEIKTCFIKKYASGKWYVGLSAEFEPKEFKSNEQGRIGIDVGLSSFATLSTGLKIEAPKFLRKSEKKLKLLQRRVSRKHKGSRNKKRSRLRFARQAEKIANQRLDFLHKLTTQQVKTYGLIGVESLNMQGMMKNHHLAKSISDASWSMYMRMLAYKAESAGCKLSMVASKNTTRQCNRCGGLQDMPLSKRIYECQSCGLVEDRDVNAAKNILERATVGLTGSNACGNLSSTLPLRIEQDISMKQELKEART